MAAEFLVLNFLAGVIEDSEWIVAHPDSLRFSRFLKKTDLRRLIHRKHRVAGIELDCLETRARRIEMPVRFKSGHFR